MLRFDIGDIPVGVHFSFLIIALIYPSRRLWEIAAWTVAVFFAVLAHELGHALTARAYGAVPVRITLFALGGATTFPVSRELTPGKRFVIAAAGSGVGIVLGGIVGLLWISGVLDEASPLVRVLAGSFIWAALVWGIANWAPIRPLDGGQMLTSALQIVAPQRGSLIARVVSGLFGAAAAVVAYAYDFTFLAFFVVLITVVGLQRDPTEHPAEEEPEPDTAEGLGEEEDLGEEPLPTEEQLGPVSPVAREPVEPPEPPEPPPQFPI